MILYGTDISVVKGNPDKKIFVVAVTYQRFENWCRSHSINPRSKMVVYIREPGDLYGQVNSWYKDLGASFMDAKWMYDLLEHYEKNRGFKEIPC